MELKKSNKAAVKVYEGTIEKADFSSEKLTGTYESVEFRSCIFDDISGINFTDCLFTSCNLSNAQVSKSKLQDVTFRDCKLIGINFFQALDFGFHIAFENCMLDYCSFATKKMNRSSFKNCKIHGANFTQADLSRSIITNCDFLDAIFSNTNLSGVDFTTNQNFIIDPQLNLIKKARFSASSLAGLLSRFDIVIE